MRFRHAIASLAFSCLAMNVFAADLTGTVTNGTTGKPAVGAEVVLVSLASGMNEVGKTKTNSQGHFTINVPDAGERHLVRVNHQGVNYFQNAPPGASSADVTIYGSSKDVAGIFEEARVYRLQTEQGQLEVMAAYTLRNESSPPRTKMAEETYEVELPPGAKLLDASAAGPGGMPVATSPVPTGKQNRYALVFPIRPGQTQFNVTYNLPYSGSYEFNITPDSHLSELGVLLPKSIKFSGLSRTFSQDRDEAGLAVFFIKDVSPHESVRFSVTGEGVAPREAQGGGPVQDTSESNAPAQPSSNSFNTTLLWYVSLAMVVVVAGGAFWLWRKAIAAKQHAVGEGGPKSSSTKTQPSRPSRMPASSSKTSGPQGDFLETLKDELFQLERDRAEGKVSQEQYEKTKAGLDALIRRQLKKAEQQKG